MKKLYRLFIFMMLLMTAGAAFADNASGGSVERYALYVASNRGGEGRETLKYAGSDAESLAKTMIEVGGVKKQNSFILVDSTREEIEGAFDNITSIIERNKYKAKRVEFVFYYSGHSDEEALLLGDEKYDYSSLKADISNVPSDVHVVMLDSCFSGNFIRAKGGSRQQSFLVDDSSIVQGHAYLSSSSESESSQESDLIGASYFTHSLVSGLRGAADTSGDNKVSLNELYYYAFNDTLANTETSIIGPQHPSFNITLVGSGDLVLTDLSAAEAMIILPAEAEGRYLVRTMEGKLASEVNKVKGSQLSIALPAGYYAVTVITAVSTGQINLKLVAGNSFTLNSDGITKIPLTTGTARGGSTGSNRGTAGYDSGYYYEDVSRTSREQKVEAAVNAIVDLTDDIVDAAVSRSRVFGYSDESGVTSGGRTYQNVSVVQNVTTKVNAAGSEQTAEDKESVKYEPLVISLFPGLSVPTGKNASAIISLSPFMSKNENIRGVQASSFIGIVNNQMNGIQVSGFLNKINGSGNGIMVSGGGNKVNGDFNGIQVAYFGNFNSGDYDGIQVGGFMNYSGGKVKGLQTAGFLNIAGDVQGSQIGLINIADSCTGVTFGLFNFIKNGINSQSFFRENGQYGWQFQGGTKYFFDTFLVTIVPDKTTDINKFVLGYGIGSRFGGDFLNFDLEILGKYILDIQHSMDVWEGLEKEFRYADDKDEATMMVMDKALLDFKDYFYPSARVTCNLRFGQHFGIFCSYNADLKIGGWNNKVFDYWQNDGESYSFDLRGTSCNVRTYWTFGVKF